MRDKRTAPSATLDFEKRISCVITLGLLPALCAGKPAAHGAMIGGAKGVMAALAGAINVYGKWGWYPIERRNGTR